jgi:predicted  nucleic acid-binding Zn-ribbon protein
MMIRCFLEKFDLEKQNLLDELDMLRRARETFEQEKRSRDQELRQIRDRSRASSDELKNAQARIQLLEQQVSFSLNSSFF